MKSVYSWQWGAWVLLCVCPFLAVTAQNASPNLSVSTTEARLTSPLLDGVASFQLDISGPDNYHYRTEIAATRELAISPLRADGLPFADGNYLMQLTPIRVLTDAHRSALQKLREAGDLAAIDAYRLAHQLPLSTEVYQVNFAIRAGKFVSPTKSEQGVSTPGVSDRGSDITAPEHLYASINYFEADYQPVLAMDNSLSSEDQVILDDLIVQGSACVGLDCTNGESFGFDTQRYKENNLRVHFFDTSNSASFPSNDWRIVINDSNNGGSNYFGIEDATGGRMPFRIEAGASANSIYVKSGGDIGFGTAAPVVKAHFSDGDTPTLRLEQNGSSGWSPFTWDVAGNESNFFIRDVTNGSKLPFRIRPGAPSNSLYINGNGNVGLGVENPSKALEVNSGDVYVKDGKLGINIEPIVDFHLMGDMNVTGTTFLAGDFSQIMSTGTSFLSPLYSTVLRIDATNEYVGIGTPAPSHQLQVSTDDVVKPTAGGWLGASDRRLKRNINDFTDGLDVLMAIRPVTYEYNGKLGFPTEEEHVGIIAQEIQTVAPYTIKPLKMGAEEEDYLAFDGSPLQYVLINAVQEQQQIIEAQQREIDELKASLSEVETLKAQMAALHQMLSTEQESATTDNSIIQTDK